MPTSASAYNKHVTHALIMPVPHLRIELVLERNNHKLEVVGRMRANVIRHALHVLCVQRRIHLIQHKEGRRLVAVGDPGLSERQAHLKRMTHL